MKMEMIDFKKYKDAGFTLIFIYLMILIFTREFGLFVKLSLIFTGFFIIGYSASVLLLKEWNCFEKSIISLFLGMGLCGLIMYILSSLRLKAVTVPTLIILDIIALALIWKFDNEENEKKN